MRTLFLVASLVLSVSCQSQVATQGSAVYQGNTSLAGASNPSVISAWGDSLTAGGQDGFGDSYPGDLQLSLNRQVLNEGVPGETSHEILVRFRAVPTQWNNTTLIWSGRNDYFSDPMPNIAAMVADLQSTRYLVMSILNAQGDPSGSSTYNEIIADNTALAAAYPSNYLDIRELLVNNYNAANGCDVANHASDMVPCSLRAVIQTGTLTAALTDTTSCPTLSVALTENNQIIQVGSEFIVELTFSGGTVLTCTRGYGSTATTHLNAAVYTAADALHLNKAGYAFVAQQVGQFIVNHSY